MMSGVSRPAGAAGARGCWGWVAAGLVGVLLLVLCVWRVGAGPGEVAQWWPGVPSPAGTAGRSARPPGPPPSVSPSVPPTVAAAVWRPEPGTRWQWQIVDRVAPPFRDVVMYDIDLTDAVPRPTRVPVAGFGEVTWPAGINAGVVEQLHAAGKVVICYLDTGAWEKYEPDAGLFPGAPGWGPPWGTDVIGNSTGWDDEYWLDVRPDRWRLFASIMWARLDLARMIGCDGVEPDQNNPYGNNPGPPITVADQKAWYLEVARQAHLRGLSVGMKNGVEVVDAQTVAAFDWSLNESCVFYQECEVVEQFVRAGKAVFHVEFTDTWRDRGWDEPVAVARSSGVCGEARRRGFSTLIKSRIPDRSFVVC